MADAIMKNFSPDGQTTFVIQDARLDSILNRNGASGGYRGIAYNSQTGGLELTQGGYYTTGFAVRESYDTNQPDSHDLTQNSVVEYQVSEGRTLNEALGEGDICLWFNATLNPGEEDEEPLQIDITNALFIYDDNNDVYVLKVYDEQNDRYDVYNNGCIQGIQIDANDMKLKFYFDDRQASAVDVYAVQLYAFDIEPVPFGPDMLGFNEGFIYVDYEGNIKLDAQLFTGLVQAIIDGNTITDDWEVEEPGGE